MWLGDEEIYNPKARKTENKNQCKVKKAIYVEIYCPVSAGQELACPCSKCPPFADIFTPDLSQDKSFRYLLQPTTIRPNKQLICVLCCTKK